ncbi:hypothetical protein QZH41_005762 [Actinostola sp. cb2023]|nr:hypothetical protein QZH41_005762 [Actinostola sp. cb2023]
MFYFFLYTSINSQKESKPTKSQVRYQKRKERRKARSDKKTPKSAAGKQKDLSKTKSVPQVDKPLGVSREQKMTKLDGVPSTSQPAKRPTPQPNTRHRKRQKIDMLQTLRKFSAGKVKIPKDRSQWAKKMADTHLEYIRKYCKENATEYFNHLEYTGSFYEHLKAEDADELDIIVALDTKNKADLIIEQVVNVPGYARIRATSRTSKYWSQFANGEGYIKPQKVCNWFFSVVQKAINEYKSTKGESDPELKVSENGPAIKLVINDKVNERKLSVDLVPAFLFKEKKDGASLPEGRHYVAKNLPEELASKRTLPCKREMLWRRSFSMDEKRKLEKLDKEDLGCRREVIKIIKTIVRNDTTLAKLSSYHVKTTFLHYNFDEGKEQVNWGGQMLPERFLEMLDYLRERIRARQLSHFFIPELNLLEEVSDANLENIEGRLTKLIENENEMRKVLAINLEVNTAKDSVKPKSQGKKPKVM